MPEERKVYLVKSGEFSVCKRVWVDEAEIVQKRTLEPLHLLDMRQAPETPAKNLVTEYGDEPTPKHDIDLIDTQPLI